MFIKQSSGLVRIFITFFFSCYKIFPFDLATLRRKNLCVPATSAQAEHVFSCSWRKKALSFIRISCTPDSWDLSLSSVFNNKLTPFIFGNGFSKYWSNIVRKYEENYHIILFTTFAKQSTINGLSNPINRNCSTAKVSKAMSSSVKSF